VAAAGAGGRTLSMNTPAELVKTGRAAGGGDADHVPPVTDALAAFLKGI